MTEKRRQIRVIIPKVQIPRIRVPRGPTIRWDIDYDNLFKNRRKR